MRVALLSVTLVLASGCAPVPLETSQADADEPRAPCRSEITGSSLPRCDRHRASTVSREDLDRAGSTPGVEVPTAKALQRKPGQ